MSYNEDKADVVQPVIELLRKGEISEDMCKVIRRYPVDFSRVGIYHTDIKGLLDLKAQQAFCPDPLSFSVQDQHRVNYIYKNLDNPNMELSGGNERRFAKALTRYYSMSAEYKCRLDALVLEINDEQNRVAKEECESIRKEEAANLLGGLLFYKKLPPITQSNFKSLQSMFNKYDLHDVYNMANNRMLLELKAAMAAESEGLLDEGMTELIFTDGGVDTEELERRITRYKIDKLRISKAEVFTPYMGAHTYIRSEVDGKLQKEKKLSEEDIAGQNPFVNVTGLAVKYFQNVLDRNRERNKAIADEKTLARVNTGSMERLVDIYRNGLSEQDVMMLKASREARIDIFCWDYGAHGMENTPVDVQKNWAFEKLAYHMGDLRPDMLTDEEMIRLTKVPMKGLSPGRAGEIMLMHLPESYFPLIEESGEHPAGVISYVKVLRNIGRVTPEFAYRSMQYYLENHMETECEPVSIRGEYGKDIKGNYYPNEDMKNPAEMFPPNLLNEQQWQCLCERYKGEANAFVPQGAYKTDRVSDVQVYSGGDGRMAIRCMVDQEQQGSKLLSDADTLDFSEKTNKQDLAVRYFSDAFAKVGERHLTLMR